MRYEFTSDYLHYSSFKRYSNIFKLIIYLSLFKKANIHGIKLSNSRNRIYTILAHILVRKVIGFQIQAAATISFENN